MGAFWVGASGQVPHGWFAPLILLFHTLPFTTTTTSVLGGCLCLGPLPHHDFLSCLGDFTPVCSPVIILGQSSQRLGPLTGHHTACHRNYASPFLGHSWATWESPTCTTFHHCLSGRVPHSGNIYHLILYRLHIGGFLPHYHSREESRSQ